MIAFGITKYQLLLFIFLSSFFVNSQNAAKQISCDCNKAHVLSIIDSLNLKGDKSKCFGNTIIAKGNPFSFEKEHFSYWFKIKILKCGVFTFTVTPTNYKDDFDFMLFKADSLNICKLIKNQRASLIRSNISKIDTFSKGIIGLHESAKIEFVTKSVNTTFVSSVNVKLGEEYILVLDNNENRKGFDLSFRITKLNELIISTFDELTKKPLECEHRYSNANNETYKIQTSKKSNWLFRQAKSNNYSSDYKAFNHVKTYSQGYLPSLYEYKESSCDYVVKLFLKKMHKDFNYIFKNIVFKEDLSIDQEASKYYLNLYKEYFLGKNPKLKISIVNIYSKFATTEESKTRAAYNLKKILGSTERISVKIDNTLSEGNNDEVEFKVLAL